MAHFNGALLQQFTGEEVTVDPLTAIEGDDCDGCEAGVPADTTATCPVDPAAPIGGCSTTGSYAALALVLAGLGAIRRRRA